MFKVSGWSLVNSKDPDMDSNVCTAKSLERTNHPLRRCCCFHIITAGASNEEMAQM